MICKPCGVAGDMIALVREQDILGSTVIPIQWACDYIGVHASAKALADYLHGMCKGSTHCDCQHQVDLEGKYIERETSGKLTSQNRESAGKAS